MTDALKALLDYEQADHDGVMVLASRQAIHEVADRIEELERADIEAGAWITEWMLADKYRKPDIPAVVRQARKAYQQTMAENERLRAALSWVAEHAPGIEVSIADYAGKALAAAQENDDG